VGYRPEMRHDFGVTVAGLAGALTGVINAWLFLVKVPADGTPQVAAYSESADGQ